MHKTIVSIAVFALMFPCAVFAHATPVEVSPASGAQLAESPSEISIRFSERLEEGSSRIKVSSASGKVVTEGRARVDEENSYLLTTAVASLSGGVYVVSWGVVSEDDGHFTKGSFAFSIGAHTAPSSATDSVVVQVTTYTETFALFVEFVGNSMLWGIVVMFALVLRRILKEERFSEHRERVGRTYAVVAFLGAGIGIIGGALQLLWKAHELSLLHEIAFAEALSMYMHTMAGTSTLYRMGALVVFALLFALLRKRIFSASSITIGEGLLLGCLLVFAYFRSIVSHATANLFYPDVSVGVNIIHLIEKDLWLGLLIMPIVFLFSSARYVLLPAIIPRVFALLSLNLVLLSCSASYIIWLHLKDFANISATLWGEHFLMLAAAALTLIGLRGYHVYALRYKPLLFSRMFAFSLPAEAAAAALTIFFSSLVIITSPPLQAPTARVFESRDAGVSIRLEKSAYEDTMALLTVVGDTKTPLVAIGEGEGALLPALAQRFEGGYVFPLALLAGKEALVAVTVPQHDGYDAHATFAVAANDFVPPQGHGRKFDTFTFVMISLALLGCFFAAGTHILVRRSVMPSDIPGTLLISKCVVGVAMGVCVVLAVLAAFQLAFGNDFKKVCESDGNMWHLMAPMKAGTPVSDTPLEGCMWGMGDFMYQFADAREYQYYKSMGPATVDMVTAPALLSAGVPTTITVSLKNADGTPATLFVDMEKLIHMVIISKDQSEFVHIHPDDIRPLTQTEIDTSTFTFNHTFPKSGEYIVAVDYAHGLTLESKQFVVQVAGARAQNAKARGYPAAGVFDGYDVSLKYSQPFEGEVQIFRYHITKNGQPVTLVPYLSAAMHISVVNNDFSTFLHIHGEVHPPGAPVPPVVVKNGKVVHSMATMLTPDTFASPVEAHLIFPSAGLYTLWGEFKTASGEIVPTSFTVRVEK